MKVFDMHLHLDNPNHVSETDSGEPNPEELLSRMAQGGVWGGCVFSNRPREVDPETGVDFETRLQTVLDWTRSCPDRLFPVLWIHPYEKDVFGKVAAAVDAGIAGFKIICNNFYIYEHIPMEVLEKIAETGKPVFFHSGILWDGRPSAAYNRPINWENLIEIEGLKFSMGHCSWPWIDECIALYGKFLDAKRRNPRIAEMFFDLTPGTPPIYRRELLTKLFTVGYEVEDNILFGLDQHATDYQPEDASECIGRDNGIYYELGLDETVIEKVYEKNLMRFLGRI